VLVLVLVLFDVGDVAIWLEVQLVEPVSASRSLCRHGYEGIYYGGPFII
jgi:hypothetical protein